MTGLNSGVVLVVGGLVAFDLCTHGEQKLLKIQLELEEKLIAFTL